MAEYIVRGIPQSLLRDGWWLSDSKEAGHPAWQHLAHQQNATNGFKAAKPTEDHGNSGRRE